jgi:hypothetical protein
MQRQGRSATGVARVYSAKSISAASAKLHALVRQRQAETGLDYRTCAAQVVADPANATLADQWCG